MNNTKKPLGLYIHIPFCKSKCYYCDFYSFRPKDDLTMENYINALICQINSCDDLSCDYYVDSIYIGGGTPSVLPSNLLFKLIEAIKTKFNPVNTCEFTIEVNPGTVTYTLLEGLNNLGVNRLSIGLQSANENELKLLGRTHSLCDFESTFSNARKAGFNNISVDLMFSIPEQTEKSLENTLDYLTKINPEHISIYDLKIEPNTVFGKKKDMLNLPSEDTEADMYENIVSFLSKKGYAQYEISNFSKNNMYSRHNFKYWNLDEYIGFGVASHSFFKNKRFSYIKNVNKYCEHFLVDKNINIIDYEEIITDKSLVGEYIMLKFRLTSGVNEKDLKNRFNINLSDNTKNKFSNFIKNGYMKYEDNNYSLTPKGMFVSNYILTEILDFDDNDNIMFKN